MEQALFRISDIILKAYGKLTTGIKDSRIRFILETFVACGAPSEILYLAKPHIGTDYLEQVVKNIRCQIQELGGEILFSARFMGYQTDEQGTTDAALYFSNWT